MRSKEMRRLVAGLWWSETRSALPTEALNAAIHTLEALAVHEGEERYVGLRVGGNTSRTWIDLGDSEYRIVVVSADGWEVVTSPQAWIRRTAGTLALPVPKDNEDGLELFREAPLPPLDDDQWALILAWLVCALWLFGPYPILALAGEQGSGKSTVARMLAGLVDPAIPHLRAPPREERDLIAARTAGDFFQGGFAGQFSESHR